MEGSPTIRQRKAARLGLAALALTCAWSATATAAPSIHHARVIAIQDGDTFDALVSERTVLRVRLASIDAPESGHGGRRPGQPFAAVSKTRLGQMLARDGGRVRLECHETDRHGRSVCDAFVQGVSVSRLMVSEGMAWAYSANERRYLRDRDLLVAQAKAHAMRAGLWSDHREPVAPWQWRKVCWGGGECPPGNSMADMPPR